MGELIKGNFPSKPMGITAEIIAGMRESLPATLVEAGADAKAAARAVALLADHITPYLLKFDALCAEAAHDVGAVKSARDYGLIAIIASATAACITMTLSGRTRV